MKLDNTIIDSLNKKYCESTVKNTKCGFNRICKIMKDIENVEDVLRNDCKDLIKALDEIPITSRSTCAFQVSYVLTANGNELTECFKKYMTNTKKSCKKTHIEQRHAKKINKDLNAEKLFRFYKDLLYPTTRHQKQFSIRRSNKAVLFSLLNDMPCRLTEFVKMGYDKSHSNYIDIDNAKMIIRKQKSKCPDRELDLSDETIEVLKYHKKNTNSKFIFYQGLTPEIPMKTANIEELYRLSVKKYCKDCKVEYIPKQSGIHSLRSNKETENLKPLLKNNITKDQMLKIVETCNKMGHSLETAIINYFRNE